MEDSSELLECHGIFPSTPVSQPWGGEGRGKAVLLLLQDLCMHNRNFRRIICKA